ncbi:hypothetical protein D3C79_741850 [compost metagenome]
MPAPSKRPSLRVTPVKEMVGLFPSPMLTLRVPLVLSLLPLPLSLSITLILNGRSVLAPPFWCTP